MGCMRCTPKTTFAAWDPRGTHDRSRSAQNARTGNSNSGNWLGAHGHPVLDLLNRLLRDVPGPVRRFAQDLVCQIRTYGAGLMLLAQPPAGSTGRVPHNVSTLMLSMHPIAPRAASWQTVWSASCTAALGSTSIRRTRGPRHSDRPPRGLARGTVNGLGPSLLTGSPHCARPKQALHRDDNADAAHAPTPLDRTHTQA